LSAAGLNLSHRQLLRWAGAALLLKAVLHQPGLQQQLAEGLAQFMGQRRGLEALRQCLRQKGFRALQVYTLVL
jgi:hypothetical protein